MPNQRMPYWSSGTLLTGRLQFRQPTNKSKMANTYAMLKEVVQQKQTVILISGDETEKAIQSAALVRKRETALYSSLTLALVN